MGIGNGMDTPWKEKELEIKAIENRMDNYTVINGLSMEGHTLTLRHLTDPWLGEKFERP